MKVAKLAWLLWWVGQAAWGCAGLEVTDARINEAPPGAQVQVGYATLHNRSAGELRLTGANSPDFGRVEFHAMTQGPEGMRMTRVAEPIIPSKGSLTFAPGGLHIMLFQPQRELRAGQQARLELHCGHDTVALNVGVLRVE